MAMLIYISISILVLITSQHIISYEFCNDNGKCSECTAGAVVCSGSSHAVDC